MRAIRTTPLGALVGALAFSVAALIGRQTVVDGHAFALIWPAAGIALAWFLMREARLISLDTAALLLAAFAVNTLTGAGLALGLLLAAVNVVQVLVHLALIRRWAPSLLGSRPRLATIEDLTTLTWTAAVAAAAATAVGVSSAAFLTGAAASPLEVVIWWGRLLSGSLIISLLCLLSVTRWRSGRPGPMASIRTRRPEFTALVAVSVGVVLVVFTNDLPVSFTLLVPTVWVAKRFSTVTMIWHVALSASAAVWFTIHGQGPFSLVEDDRLAVLSCQALVTVMVALGLFIAVGRDERSMLLDTLSKANVASQRQAQLMASIVDSMSEGVTAVDEHGNVLLQNPAAMRLLQIDVVQPLDRLAPKAVGADGTSIPHDERPSVRALRGEHVQEDILLRQTDGEVRHVAVSASPLPPIVDGDPHRAVMVFHDVTAERQQRAELKAFAGVVAHDLNNPLTAIAGWNSMLLSALEAESCTKEQVHTLASRVQTSTQRLHELIEGLLDRAASNDRTLEIAPVDLDDLLTRVVESRGIEAKVEWHRLPAVRADRVLAGQLLDNLVGNAIKYVAPGVDPHVRVSARSEQPGWVTIAVADNGIGIPEGEHEAVFDEFRRAHAEGGYEGTGLGLSIVKRIITRHDGTICAAPNPSGQGTVFEFTLPAA